MRLRNILAAVLFASVIPIVAMAQGFTRNVEINVHSSFDPAQAVGLIFSSSGTEQKLGPKLRRVSEDMIVVSFPVVESSISADTFGSALVISNDGQVALGDVKSLALRSEHSSFYSLAACIEQEDPSALRISEVGPIQRLVEFRSKRRAVSRDKIKLLLNEDFLQKIAKLEQGFGLDRTKPLAADTHPLEIIDRASRLIQAITAYKNRPVETKKLEATPEPTKP
jgi:hypothetical protein